MSSRTIRRSTGWRLLAALAVAAAIASAPAHAHPSVGIGDAKALIKAECAAGRFSGLMTIMVDGREAAFEACGRTAYPDGPAISRATRFKLFSMSKQFTAAAIVRLADAKRLSLDDTIGRWLPQAPPAWRDATIRNLLMHRAGVPNDIDGYARDRGVDSAADLDAWLANNQTTPADFAAGTQYRYSNMGYELLTRIAEKATARPWPDVLEREVLRPSRMRTAILERPNIVDGKAEGPALDPQLAQGYNGAPGQLEEATSFAFVLRGSGALHATLADLQAYERGLVRGRPLNVALQTSMFDSAIDRYGLGWIVRKTPAGNVTVSHSGGTNGFAVEYGRIPSRRIAVILLSNFGFSDVEGYRRQILEQLDPAPGPKS